MATIGAILTTEQLDKLNSINEVEVETVREEAKDYSNITPREHQMYVTDALNLRVIDLFNESDEKGYRLLSRGDIILIHSTYDGFLNEFLEDYKKYVKDLADNRGYTVVYKPHYFFKNKIG